MASSHHYHAIPGETPGQQPTLFNDEQVLVRRSLTLWHRTPVVSGDSARTAAHAVFILEFKAPPENRLAPAVLECFSDILDYLEAPERAGGPTALLCLGSGRFFCNGFDLKALAGLPRAEERQQFTVNFAKLLARILVLPYVTVAVVNGHAFGGGFVFAAAFDMIVMNQSRGWLCMPAIKLGITLPHGLLQCLRRKVSNKVLATVVLQCERLDAKRALELGVVNAVAPREHLLETAARLATHTLVNRDALSQTKRLLSLETLHLLHEPSIETRGLPSKL